ncbi:MAG: hypothetical protein JWQ43_2137 [Glaciihabitans sp.]|nr:hypothetical protein [Glaciihabitans sp.]
MSIKETISAQQTGENVDNRARATFTDGAEPVSGPIALGATADRTLRQLEAEKDLRAIGAAAQWLDSMGLEADSPGVEVIRRNPAFSRSALSPAIPTEPGGEVTVLSWQVNGRDYTAEHFVKDSTPHRGVPRPPFEVWVAIATGYGDATSRLVATTPEAHRAALVEEARRLDDVKHRLDEKHRFLGWG